VLPPFAKTKNGPNELKTKAVWRKIQESQMAETLQESKRTAKVISHQKSASALTTYVVN
jgi:hypothetical protein